MKSYIFRLLVFASMLVFIVAAWMLIIYAVVHFCL